MLLMLLLSLFMLMHGFVYSRQAIHSLAYQIQHGLTSLRTILLALAIRLSLHKYPRHYGKASAITGKVEVIYRTRAKPEWVKHEVLRIKHPAASYGVLTALFKLLAFASLRPKERGIEPEEIKGVDDAQRLPQDCRCF